jgi:alpha-L-fucosidase
MKFKQSNHYVTLIITCLVLLLSNNAIGQKNIPLPKANQLTWQDAELTALISYDLHVFDGKRYNQAYNRINPIADYSIFNPVKLDTDQWIRAVKDMGGKIAILTATHETGFALYQSDVNPYSMKALKFQDGKGDIVRDFVASCRKYGVLPGIYIGIRWNSNYGIYDFKVLDDNSPFAKNRQQHYNKLCEKMTEELMSRYGELAMVWFDGGAHGPELGGPNILPMVEKYQPNIIFYHNTQRADIRWGGSETGMVNYPCYGTFPFPYSHSTNQKVIFKNDFQLLKEGDPEGQYYMPAMSDAPLRGYKGRHEWFWEPGDEDHIEPLDNLMEMYYGSVGRNSTLILGITPNAEGLIPEPDVNRLKEFGKEIKTRFSSAIAQGAGKGNSLALNLKTYKKIDHLILMEDITQGERIREFKIEGKTKNGWQLISKGSNVGHKFIARFKELEVSALRLSISKSLAEPIIKDFSTYYSLKK